MTVKELTPAEVKAAMDAGHCLVIDVREPHEHDNEKIPGAVLFPLSSFVPANLPDAGGKTVILHCAGGVRSIQALQICQQAGLNVTCHMKGGINAWKADRLPTE